MPHASTPDITRQPTIWARLAGRVLEHAAARGADSEQLRRATGLERVDLRDPDGRIPLVAAYDLLERAAEAAGDPLLGLHFALTLTVEDMDALGFLALSSPTLRVSLERVVEYQRLWNDGERYDLADHGDQVALRFTPFGPPRPAHAYMAQMFVADVAVNGQAEIPALRPLRIRLRQQPLTAERHYREALGLPVELGAAVDEVRFPAEVMDLPMPGADAALHGFMCRYADHKLAELPPADGGLLERLRALIVAGLPDGRAELGPLAGALHLSARTLQRRLRDAGTSLSAEIEAVRRQQAHTLLASRVAIAEVSWLLGYSDPTAFGRAFKRWTGVTPAAWRAG